MKNRVNEHTILFLSTIKWTILAVIVGVIVGTATHIFMASLDWGIAHYNTNPYYYLTMPLALFVSGLMIKYLAPDAEGHGTEKVIEAVHKKFGHIKPLVVPVKLIASIITIVAGGAVGKEGPCAQIGSGIASVFADFLHLNNRDHQKIVICGIGAGFAAVFGTPIAGAIFGVEVLFIGKILYDVLFPSLVAGIVSFEVSVALGTVPLRMPVQYTLQNHDLPFIFLAGVVFGITALGFILISNTVEHFFVHTLKIWSPAKGFLGGFILIGLTLLLGTHQYLGLSTQVYHATLAGQPTTWYAPIIKAFYNAVTLGTGGSGGVLAPLFYIGSSVGNTFATVFHQNVAFFAALGMVGVLAAATNTPIACTIMGLEIFGPAVLIPGAVVCTISYLINGHNSVYPSQILAFKKSGSLDVETEKEIRDVEVSVGPELEKLRKKLIGERAGILPAFDLSSIFGWIRHSIS